MSHHQRGVTFSESVSASSTETESYNVAEPATVESVSVRIYPGAQLDLEIEPYIYRGEQQQEESLVRYQGKQYLDGDDDKWTFSVSIPVSKEDEIRVRATNNDGSNAYDYRVNVELDEYGGVERPLTSFFSRVF